MAQAKKVQDTHISRQLKALHAALIGLVGVMNRPQNDERLIHEAGIKLDQALFRLLVVIERVGPIGVVELADRLGRDYTTISRQVARLEKMELVVRSGNPQDRRIREAVVSDKGKAMTEQLDVARERLGRQIVDQWPREELDELVRLMQKLVAGMQVLETQAVPARPRRRS